MISVIMSTHNRASTLKRSIESILNQTYTDFEFIICDDCSTDDTFNILMELSNKDKRVILLRNDTNLGLQKSLNRCLDVCRGKYIARMDDDDISMSDRLSVQKEFLENNLEYSFVGSNVNEVFDNYSLITNLPLYPSKYDLIKRNQFVHPSIMIKSSDIKSVGGYSEDVNHLRVEDYELWLRLYSYGYFGANIKKPLLDYSKVFTNTKLLDRKNKIKLVHYYIKKLGIPKYYEYLNVLTAIKFLIPYKLKKIIRIKRK